MSSWKVLAARSPRPPTRSPEQASSSDPVAQTSVPTPEKKSIEGTEQQPGIIPFLPKKKKKTAPAAQRSPERASSPDSGVQTSSLIPETKEIEGIEQQQEINPGEPKEEKKTAPAAKSSPEQVSSPDSGVQISIPTPERKDIEGTEQQQELTPKKPKKKKRSTPVAKKETVYKEFLLIRPLFKAQTKVNATDKDKPRRATLQEAKEFVLTWGGSPKVEKLTVYKEGESFRLKLKLPKKFKVDSLLRLWNATHFADTIFTVVRYQEINWNALIKPVHRNINNL